MLIINALIKEMLCSSRCRKGRKLAKKARAQETWGGCQELQRIGEMKTPTVQTNHPVSHRLNYLQANRKAIGRFLMSLTKKGMVKNSSDHNNLFRELQGKKTSWLV